MELREMRAFVAVVEEGGMSAAARRLHVSQPALSQTIAGLEKAFGVELLVRSRAGVSATGAGMILLGEARELIARHERLDAAMARLSPAQGTSWLPSATRRFAVRPGTYFSQQAP